jgi:hypothetical protein
MATQVTTSLPQWLTGCTYDGSSGNDLRNSSVTPTFYDEGIVTSSAIGVLGGVIGGAGLAVGPGTGMNVTVGPGSFVVPNSATPTAGGYVSTLASLATLTVQTADPTNPRIDIVVAYVSDVGSSSSFGAVEIITGTAAPSPTAPSAPANSITLGQLAVAAGTVSINSGMITDSRPYTTTAGGVLKAAKGAVTGYTGQIAYDPASASFYHNTPSGPSVLPIMPWVPLTSYKTTDTISIAGAIVNVASATVTVDGNTDLAIYVKATGIYMSASHGEFGGNLQVYLDGTLIDEMVVFNTASDGVVRGGGSFTAYTAASQGTTPSAGSHTVAFKFQGIDSTGVDVTLRGATYSPAVMRVSPVGR